MSDFLSDSGYIRFTGTDDQAMLTEIPAKQAQQFISITANTIAFYERYALDLLSEAGSETGNPMLVEILTSRAAAYLKAADVYRQRLTTLTSASGIVETLLVAYIKQQEQR